MPDTRPIAKPAAPACPMASPVISLRFTFSPARDLSSACMAAPPPSSIASGATSSSPALVPLIFNSTALETRPPSRPLVNGRVRKFCVICLAASCSAPFNVLGRNAFSMVAPPGNIMEPADMAVPTANARLAAADAKICLALSCPYSPARAANSGSAVKFAAGNFISAS